MSNEEKSQYKTSVRNLSQSGAEKLREMTENNDTYIDFLKFQGRVFKHSASVALEFFTQRPEAKFIATREQWVKTNRTVAMGSEAIRFVDSDGRNVDFYDFSQVEETIPPYQWTINSKNANEVKSQLGIPEKIGLTTGIINTTVTNAQIVSCMSALGIPPNNFNEFRKSYLNAIQLVIAGRLEIGGNNFNIPSDLTALKMLKTESQKLAFLTYAANTAREALMKIEKTVQNINTAERNEYNDLREMENTDRRRKDERAGRGTSVNTSGNAGEQSYRSESNESGRRVGLGNNTESSEWKEHKMVSGIQNENDRQSEILVQVRPDMRTLQYESDRPRTVSGGRTNRNLWNEMDDVHGRKLSASGGGNEIVSQVSDSSSLGGQVGDELQGHSGRTVHRDESTSYRLRGSAEMGTSEDVLLRQHSDERDSFSSSDRNIEEKLNMMFSSELSDETEKTSTEKADVFIFDEKLSDEESLVQITTEIGENQKKFADLINNNEYEKATEISQKLTSLTQTAAQLTKSIQEKPLTEDDVKQLRNIRPARKSVQNMLEPEVARTTKFESLLDKKMGGKSPYTMRKNGGNDWRNDESQKVNIVKVHSHKLSEDIKLLRKSENVHNIPTGKFENDDTKVEILFNPDSIKETVAKALLDSRNVTLEARMNALYHMKEIIKNAVCFDSQVSEYHPTKSKNKSPNTLFMHRMYGVFMYDDKPYLASLAVEEMYLKNEKHQIDRYQNRLYNFKDIKITPMKPGFDPRDQMPHGIGNVSTGVEISIPQLYEFVKSLDTNFFENPDSPGREAREAECFLQAKYIDSVNNDENKSETKNQIIEFAKSHSIPTHKAAEDLKEIVDVYNQFPANGKTKNDIKRAKNHFFDEKVKAAFLNVAESENYNSNQKQFMENLQKFTIANNVSGNPIDAAFQMNSRFKEIYNSENWVDSNIFGGRFSSVADKLTKEFKQQMELLKKEKAELKKVPAEKGKKSAPEVINTDLTKGVEKAPQIKLISSDLKIDMEEIPQLVFLETDNSDGKVHFNETIFTYDIENVSVEIQESFDNLYDFDVQETLSVENGTARINELMELYPDRNMHISVVHENGERESLNQYISHASGNYPVIEAFFNNNVPEFTNPQAEVKKSPKSKIYTVQEYNKLLEKASKNIQDSQVFKLHFKVIMSEKRSYSETFNFTKDTGTLSEILKNSENNNHSNRNFLKALKMISEEENSPKISEIKSDLNDTTDVSENNQPAKPSVNKESLPEYRPLSIKRRREILSDFAEKNGLGKIDIWKKVGNPASYRIAESESGNRLFNEQLCIFEKGEILSEEKLLKYLEEFSKSDFFVQYQQKKADELKNKTETKNEQKYPFVSVKAGLNYSRYIFPELEEKNYTVPEFNDALKKLSERWNGEEYETKTAFVTLTIHLNQTESYEKRLNAEYQFESLSQRLEYDNDSFDSEQQLRKVIREVEKSTKNDDTLKISEFTDKEKKFLSSEIAPKSVDDLKIGDVIRYEGENWKITNIQENFSINFENIDKNSVMPVRSLIGHWKEQLERDGFEYIQQTDVEVKTENPPEKNNITDSQMSLFNEVSDVKGKEAVISKQPLTRAERPLTAFTNKNRNNVNTDTKTEISEPEEPEINDKSPELRAVLNKFSEKYGLGELNVEPYNYTWKLSEKFQDGTDFMLGEIYSPEYGKPFTPEELQTALEKFEEEIKSRNQNIKELYERKSVLESHGGVSELPKVKKNLPEITYASRPSEKISNNMSAIREMIRLEEADKNNENPYDARSNQYNSKQTSEHRLRQYCGWGGLSQVFDERFKQYEFQRQELKKMLTSEEYAEAKASSLNAHYTPQIIIDAMYRAVKNMDLPRDARILEPSCGTGNFISRLPHNFSDAEVTGIELDSVTARIAKQINRDNEKVQIINSGFENTNLENGSFDLAIGNVPFGDYNMNDPDYVQDWKIHDAFFRKALDKVAPGGVVAFVTSTGTMDKSSPKVREYLAIQAELVGAVRLPNNAFSDAGTGVPSDIIFLKKRENPLQSDDPKPDWCYTIPDKNGLKINSYFVQNPQMILGEMKKTTFQDRLTCEPFENADLEKQLNEAIKNLNAKITVAKREKTMNEQCGKIEPWGKNFTFQLKDDKVYYRQNSNMNEIKCTESEKEKIKSLCLIRDMTRKLIDLQKTSIPDSELIPVRENLNKIYDEYKSNYGEISSKQVKKLFANDSDYPILQSLENYNKKTGETEKADIFFRRTVNPMLEIKSVENTEEALQVSLDRKGKPDILYMAVLLDEIPEKVCSELIEKGYIFIDPEKELPDKPFSGVTERSEYLSGNVRMKLTIAEEYAKTNSEYSRNIEALKTVIPEDIKSEEISVQMGCAWIEPQDYTAFLEHLSGRTSYNSRRCDVSYSPVTGEFSVMNAGSKQSLNLNETTTYGTADYNMYQLAEKIMNQRRIVVQREKTSLKDPSKTVTRTDPKATKIALEKAKLIRAEFKKWIFADEQRKIKYERKYNDIFNSIVGREYDGSHLTFAGMANDFILRLHQKNCVARAIYGGNTLAAHVVGAGKSAVIFSSVMKKKELGLINKACVVVPKALTEQTANEWRKVYLDAKILTVTNDDLSNESKRNIFTAKVATGSYDAVILSQEQFEKIPMSKQYRIQFMKKELDGLEDMLREKKLQNNGKKDYSIKAIEKSKKQLQVKLEKLINPKSASKAKDDLLEFEQLGFDYLVCDEAHAYKNGFVTTKMTNVAGVTTRPSGRAEDMQMKTDYFNEQLGQGHILFATGTPVSNSMTELYVMTRYLRPDLLKQAGVERFDDWAATFGNVVTKNQQTADGTLKMKTSFASFTNLPELMAMYKEFADVQSADKLNLPRPELKTGKAQIISVPATPEQKEYVHKLAERAKNIENGTVEPYEDNHLKITGEARLIGLGNNAVKALYEKRGEELPYDFIDSKDSKVDKCIEKVTEIYNQTEDTKGVQIIFSDVAVNSDNGNFSVYDYIKDELITKGIPENEIIFAPKSDSKERENIFRDINNSKYRVVIASTSTLGTGANIQQNLCALHHIDVPWKPSDFEQREGRILRQGNKNKEVEIFNYVTEGTLDSYLYQTVTNKARFIAQLLDDKAPARVSEDCDEKVLTFGEIQAAAEGNPDFKRRIEVSNEIAELTMLKNEYVHETAAAQEKTKLIPEKIKLKKEILSHVQNDKKAAEKIQKLALSGLEENKDYVVMTKESVNAHLLKMARTKIENPEKEIPPVNINNFEVSVYFDKQNDEVRFQVKGEHTYSCTAGTSENQDNYQRLNNLFEKAIPKQEQEIIKDISALEENLAQAKERAETPFVHEKELEEKLQEFQELEEKLSGLSVQEDVVFDPEEEPIIETAEEKSEREKVYNVDNNDYQPTENNLDFNCPKR